MNSISGIVSRPAAIQFGSDRRPVPRIIDEVRSEESDTFINVEDTPPPVRNRGVHWNTNLTATPPQVPPPEPFVRTTNQDIHLPAILPASEDDSEGSISPPAPFLARLEPLTNVQTLRLRSPQETQRARLLPTREDLTTIGGNVLGGTPDSYNGSENEDVSPVMPIIRPEDVIPSPPTARTLPTPPLNLDESPFINVQRDQETQRFRLLPRPRALHPIRNLAELSAALGLLDPQPSESQNSRPGTPDSQPDPNQQNQPA